MWGRCVTAVGARRIAQASDGVASGAARRGWVRQLSSGGVNVSSSPPVPAVPTTVTVDLDAIRGNVRALRSIVGPDVVLAPAVKQNAYGHGATAVGRAALSAGADMLSVASIAEAAGLREDGVTQCPLLCMGYVPPRDIAYAIANNVTVTVAEPEVLAAYAQVAASMHATLNVHIKVDTGMGRFGVMPDAAVELAKAATGAEAAGVAAGGDEDAPPAIQLGGVYTHFSVASDAGGERHTAAQAACLDAVVDSMKQAGVAVGAVHCANSAATLLGREYHRDIVRPGIALYGLEPGDVQLPKGAGFAPALEWTTELASVKTLPANHAIGYGNKYVTSAPCRVGLVPTGYGDGYRRGPRTYGHVLIGGVKCPILGRVSMEKTVVGLWPADKAAHAAGAPLPATGSHVTLVGRQGPAAISVEEAAANAGTNNYEVVTAMVPRAERNYVNQ